MGSFLRLLLKFTVIDGALCLAGGTLNGAGLYYLDVGLYADDALDA